MDDRYMRGTHHSCKQNDCITFEHHYRVDLFIAMIDHQLMELKNRFTEDAMELLKLTSTLDPRDSFKFFVIEDICSLIEKFYYQDFARQEISVLRSQLQYYKLDVIPDSRFQNMSTISGLCQGLAETRKFVAYNLVDRLIRLVLTLPVSTTTTKRAFSAMKIVKTELRNKMNDEFLKDCMIICIEREFVKGIDVESVVDEFDSVPRRAQLH